MKPLMRTPLHILAGLVLALAGAPAPAAPESGGGFVTLGTQPLAVPIVTFTEAVKRDRVLQGQLAKDGWHLRERAFVKGADMIQALGAGELDAAVLGDIPAIHALARHDLLIAGLLKNAFSSVVLNRYMPLDELKGKRIGNGTGSTAHYTLIEGLATAGLSDKDVELVEIPISEMPAALAAGKIDAFSAWEPAPTIALASNPNHFVVYRGVNSSYLVLRRALVEEQPQLARQFVAAFARAFHWMRKSPDNLRRAAAWAVQAGKSFSAKPQTLTVDQAMAITRREALDVPGAPALPKGQATASGRMARQMEFLKHQGMVPSAAAWERVGSRFAPQLIEDVLRQPERYRVYAFDYGPD